jgi:hypothetical protein
LGGWEIWVPGFEVREGVTFGPLPASEAAKRQKPLEQAK